MKVKVGVSMRHVHLTEEDYQKLFNEPMKIKRQLNQPGAFATEQTVTLRNKDRFIENVRIIGPSRNYTQVEISRTDAYYLKIDPPIRESGNLKGAEEIEIIGEKGSIIKKSAIIADRHIHITKDQRKEFNLYNDKYSIKVDKENGGVISNVSIKEGENAYFEFHIDSDIANAFGLKQNDEVEII